MTIVVLLFLLMVGRIEKHFHVDKSASCSTFHHKFSFLPGIQQLSKLGHKTPEFTVGHRKNIISLFSETVTWRQIFSHENIRESCYLLMGQGLYVKL